MRQWLLFSPFAVAIATIEIWIRKNKWPRSLVTLKPRQGARKSLGAVSLRAELDY